MLPTSPDTHKISIIGCGRVGTSIAYAVVLQGIADQLVLINRTASVAKGEALDLSHGMPFLQQCQITGTDDYTEIADSDLIIITAGAAQKPGETRLDLTRANSAILREVMAKIMTYAPNSIVMVVSNPVDVLTYQAYLQAGWPKGRIFGTGTTLDTARFRFHLSEFLDVNANSIHAYILGEHGDTSFPVISSATVGGQSLMTFPKFSEGKAKTAYEQARQAAYKIIETKGATYYGIGIVAARLAKAVLRDEGLIFPVSVPLHHYYGLNGVALSVPCVLGRKGVEETLEIKLNWEEKQLLEKSAQTIKQFLA